MHVEWLTIKLMAQLSNQTNWSLSNLFYYWAICSTFLFAESKNSFIKKAASHLLGSIPASPAFAAEFPSKEIALGLRSVGESSNSAAHVSAGMIRITNLSLSGNGMDWTLGKSGEINVMLSSQVDAPAALVPVSGLLSCKAAFVVSHGWIFLMFFSILILSLSFKIGSFMYTGKWLSEELPGDRGSLILWPRSNDTDFVKN